MDIFRNEGEKHKKTKKNTVLNMNAVFSKSNNAAESSGRKKILPRESQTNTSIGLCESPHSTRNKPSNHIAPWKVSDSIIQRSQN